MIDNKIILKNKEAEAETSILGISGENEQQRLIFSFEGGFIDGTCYLELELPDGRKGSIKLDKEDETYCVIVKNSLLTQTGEVRMQLKIIQKTAVWKSIIFKMTVIEAIKALETIEEDYPNWIVRMHELDEAVKQISDDVANLKNYDDTEIKEEIEQVKKDVESIEVPTKVGELENDEGFLKEETDPTVPQHVKDITEQDIENWNNKSDFSGNYEDLANKPQNLATEQFVKNKIDEIDKSTDAITTEDGKTLSTVLTELIASINSKATPQDINDRINELVDGAPETFDTLKEIADYIAKHEEIATALNEAIGNKVDKEDGKGLTSNDFTDADKNKLDGLENLKTGDFLNDGSITPKKTNFFNIVENLFDMNDVAVGAILKQNGILDVSFDKWRASNYIKVEAGETYYFGINGAKEIIHLGALYDEDKKFLEGLNNIDSFTASQNGYVRFSRNNGFIGKWQLQKGSLNEYVEYGKPRMSMKEEYYISNELINDYRNKKILILGDSITALDTNVDGWVKYFVSIVKPSLKVNIAVSGATWKDKEENQIYDGNPQINTDGNTIGNQVQKVINEKESGNSDYADFDVIIIAAGTNDSGIETIESVENQFVSNYNTNNYTVVSLEDVNRQTFAGIMRYTYEKMYELYPNAKMVICTPLQECYESFESIYNKGKLFEYIASRLGITCWNSRDCGICNLYENQGSSNRDLVDGLHTNVNGAQKLGEYNARKFKELFS